MAENLAANALKMREKELFYWKNKHKVDFIVKEGSDMQAINISIGYIIEKREIESLLEFKSKLKSVKKLILITKDIDKAEEKIKYIPLWKWLIQGHE